MDEARRIASNIAKMPKLLRKGLGGAATNQTGGLQGYLRQATAYEKGASARSRKYLKASSRVGELTTH
jgi:hypothetical protein